MLGLLPPDSPHLESILVLLSSRDHLWSDYGIRSLSASHPLFGQGENYWRGPIWIQMNYMVLHSLYTVSVFSKGGFGAYLAIDICRKARTASRKGKRNLYPVTK